MKLSDSLREKLLAGALVLVPVAVVALLLRAAVQTLHEAVFPAMAAVGIHSVVAGLVAILLAVLILLGLTLALGYAVGTAIGKAVMSTAERMLLRRVPGYDLFTRVVGGLGGGEDGLQPALVEIYRPGAAVFCLVMETLPDGRRVVFAPSSPAMTVGSVHIVAPELVEEIDAGMIELAGVASGWGVGAAKMLKPGDDA